jgi:steroid delta-isomerase-like uncharacterized protein
MTEASIAVVRRWFHEVWALRRAETIDELLSEESTCYGESEPPMRGVAEFKARQHTPFLAAFPDLHVQLDDILAVGAQVVVRWSAVGTHTGDGLGFPPTGKSVNMHGMTWLRLEDGKLKEGWQYSTIPDTLRSLAVDTGNSKGERGA